MYLFLACILRTNSVLYDNNVRNINTMHKNRIYDGVSYLIELT